MVLAKTARAAIIPLLLLAFAAWVVELAGLAALQQKCQADTIGGQGAVGPEGIPFTSGFNAGVVGLPFGIPGGCKKYFRFLWWVWAFNLVPFLATLATAATRLFRNSGNGWFASLIGLLAIGAVLHMFAANHTYNMVDLFGGSIRKRAKVALVGFAIKAAADTLLLMALGLAHDNVGDAALVDKRATTVPAGQYGGTGVV